ncbi:uncharacterized protein LOC129729363 [Wyeomyia smithii]|uniref:uncharacterized protein LOC129729363 n=1 Tax=Wyeomyia smithii TaxID=174621 RepID=UPI002467D090|nr:uncharacterized protein LOC129729363 [Wyeomyia smithii]
MQRYTLDLSEFYSDHRQKIFVGKRGAWKRIGSLLEHVRYAFQLPEIYFTNQDDVLFPEIEDLDVILESDLIKVRKISNSYSNAHIVRSPSKSLTVEPRAFQQNGNGKHKLESSADSSSESDADDSLPKIFTGLKSRLKNNETHQELLKPKRKRIRKRKSKKKDEDAPPPKVIVKTYGRTKMPAIVADDGVEKKHIRFNEDDPTEKAECIEEPYRNLNKSIAPRIVKASQQTSHTICNNDAPTVPEYKDSPIIGLQDAVCISKRNKSQRQPRKSLEIKQELITASTPIPTVASNGEVDHHKEKFIISYSGIEFWSSLQEVLPNFPLIEIPSENDIITFRYRDVDYLAFVERADDGENDASPALKLTLRRLNTDNSEHITVTLDYLTEMRLVATYQGFSSRSCRPPHYLDNNVAL